MNVEVDDVQRKLTLAILPHYFFDDRFRIVAVATLLHAQRPKRRHRHVPGQISIAAENLFDRWPIEKIVVKFPALRSEPNAFLRPAAELEVAAIAVIKEDSVGRAILQPNKKRNCLVDRIAPLGIAGRVGIPVDEKAATLV